MSMNFPNNSIILIEGKNGSGKSVTFKNASQYNETF